MAQQGVAVLAFILLLFRSFYEEKVGMLGWECRGGNVTWGIELGN